jgi:hypothetical protein
MSFPDPQSRLAAEKPLEAELGIVKELSNTVGV